MTAQFFILLFCGSNLLVEFIMTTNLKPEYMCMYIHIITFAFSFTYLFQRKNRKVVRLSHYCINEDEKAVIYVWFVLHKWLNFIWKGTLLQQSKQNWNFSKRYLHEDAISHDQKTANIARNEYFSTNIQGLQRLNICGHEIWGECTTLL